MRTAYRQIESVFEASASASGPGLLDSAAQKTDLATDTDRWAKGESPHLGRSLSRYRVPPLLLKPALLPFPP